MITLLKQTKRMMPFAIVFSVVAVMVFQACRRYEAMDKSQPVNINAAHAWLKQDGGLYKSEAINFPLDNGTTVTGKLDWNQTISYTWNGRSYLEIPYLFNGKREIGNSLSSFNMVIRRTKDGKNFEGALRTTSTDTSAQDIASDEKDPSTVSAYFLPDGAPANMWAKNSKTKETYVSAKTISLTNEQIAAMRADKSTTKARQVMNFCWTTAVRYTVAGSCPTKSPQKKVVDDGGFSYTLEEEICITTETYYITDCIYIDDGLGPGGGKITPQNDDPFPPNPRGGGETDDETLDLTEKAIDCDSAKVAAGKADSAYNGGKVDSTIKKMGNIDSIEKGFNLYQHLEYADEDAKERTIPSYIYTGAIFEGDKNHIESNETYNPRLAFLVGFAHSHPYTGYLPPSAYDIGEIMQSSLDDPRWLSNYIIAANGDVYSTGVTDRAAAQKMLATVKNSIDPATQSWKKDSEIGMAFQKAQQHYEQMYKNDPNVTNLAYEMAMSAVLSKFDMGVTVMKKDVTGKFKPVIQKVTETTGRRGKITTTYSDAGC